MAHTRSCIPMRKWRRAEVFNLFSALSCNHRLPSLVNFGRAFPHASRFQPLLDHRLILIFYVVQDETIVSADPVKRDLVGIATTRNEHSRERQRDNQ